MGDRSVKKGPFVRHHDNKAVERLLQQGKSGGTIKTHYRDSMVLPKFVGCES